MKEQIESMASWQILPLLASFITEDKKKQHYLNSAPIKEIVLTLFCEI
jgi:hypothetical protein